VEVLDSLEQTALKALRFGGRYAKEAGAADRKTLSRSAAAPRMSDFPGDAGSRQHHATDGEVDDASED
jgi:hypothetical protein